MTPPPPLYRPQNVRFAYQLNWSLTVFWREPVWTDDWFPALQQATEPDGIRLLNHRYSRPDISLFLASTKPEVAPLDIPRRVKGRLQHLLGGRTAHRFRRNYDLRSLGSTRRDKLEAYVEGQVEHHNETLPEGNLPLQDLQIVRPDVDLAQPRFTSHARYWCNLHLVLVRQDRQRETQWSALEAVRSMIVRASRAKGHLLSRLGLLPDHLHLLLGISPAERPAAVALSYMNNVAFACGMRPVLQQSCFVGTFGEYDLGAVVQKPGATDTRSVGGTGIEATDTRSAGA